jgi:hypothetical protein
VKVRSQYTVIYLSDSVPFSLTSGFYTPVNLHILQLPFTLLHVILRFPSFGAGLVLIYAYIMKSSHCLLQGAIM